jgi:glucose-6-phosphate isomerase
MTLHSDIQLDFNYMLAEKLDSEHGLTIEEIESTFPTAIEIQKALTDLFKLGQLPFQELPFETESAKQIRNAGEKIRSKFSNIVVLGIGGSGLGPACAYEFLKSSRNSRLFVVDNVDPSRWQDIEAAIELKNTFFIVISKSGKTVETLAAFAYFRDKLIHHLGKNNYRNNLAIITDPEAGPLRTIAREEDILSFGIPPGVGGRYSVLTPVGLFPAACVGLDIESLLAGARSMHERSLTQDLWINPPYISGILSFLAATKKGKNIRTLMPYSEKLETYTEWFSQLWAESIGKRNNLKGEEIFAGTTPARAMGATDQHSQLQLYLEGPRDKFITFYTVEDSTNQKIPESYSQCEEMKKLAGKNVSELLDIEYRATERALKNEGIPSMTLKLPHPDAATLGQLFYMAEVETVVTGELYNINPFDQPAVESIKKYIKALLGMPGFEKELKEIEGATKDERYII